MLAKVLLHLLFMTLGCIACFSNFCLQLVVSIMSSFFTTKLVWCFLLSVLWCFFIVSARLVAFFQSVKSWKNVVFLNNHRIRVSKKTCFSYTVKTIPFLLFLKFAVSTQRWAVSGSETVERVPPERGCTTFSLLPAELHLFLWITAASEFKMFLFFCIASVLLPHTQPSLLPYVCLVVFLLSIVSSRSRQRVFIGARQPQLIIWWHIHDRRRRTPALVVSKWYTSSFQVICKA